MLATGMGKTWLSAFDVMQMQAKNVLFVAHREEILLQAEKTFSQLIPTPKLVSTTVRYKMIKQRYCLPLSQP